MAYSMTEKDVNVIKISSSFPSFQPSFSLKDSGFFTTYL